jgi:hypothetical protein
MGCPRLPWRPYCGVHDPCCPHKRFIALRARVLPTAAEPPRAAPRFGAECQAIGISALSSLSRRQEILRRKRRNRGKSSTHPQTRTPRSVLALKNGKFKTNVCHWLSLTQARYPPLTRWGEHDPNKRLFQTSVWRGGRTVLGARLLTPLHARPGVSSRRSQPKSCPTHVKGNYSGCRAHFRQRRVDERLSSRTDCL